MKHTDSHEEPIVRTLPDGKKIKNPNQITIVQHVIQMKHLLEFANPKGLVSVHQNDKTLCIPPKNKFFAAMRLWGQYEESCIMKPIEDSFQRELAFIKSFGEISNHHVISQYYLLWLARSIALDKGRPNYKSIMVPDVTFSKEELEKNELENVERGMQYIIPGGDDSNYANRITVGLFIHSFIIQNFERHFRNKKWEVVKYNKPELHLPDQLTFHFLKGNFFFPATPSILLIENKLKDDMINNLASYEINSAFYLGKKKYIIKPPF
ncbi:hypothetical protein ACCY16_24620 [Candidatus Pantoea formicae]|uniref:hypothetical protein n=1 Tax=Candidatus Pantoea formicae TaxID=2608355 RepID=UPI003EDB3A6D